MLDSNYSELLRILGNSGGDTSIKYDSPYSIALAILEANGVDTSTKHYDSLYSILEEIEEMGGGGQEEKFTFTINPTPSDAEVSINGSTGNSYEALGGEEIDWEVSKTGYTSQEGEYIMRRDDYSMNVTLQPVQVTFTITPTPADAVVVMNGVQQSSVTVNAGSTVSWSVSKTGYVTQSSTTTVYDDVTLPVTLALEQYTFTINPTPADATVVINNVERSSITADYGTAISWSVSKLYYGTQSGTATLTADHTENVTLVADNYWNFINTSLDNTVEVDGEVLSESTVFPGQYAFTAPYGSTHTWRVSRTGYVTQSGTMTVAGGGTTVTVTLVPEQTQYTLTFDVTPNDATITVDGTVLSGNTYTGDSGDTISYEISKTNYETVTSSKTITQNETITVVLQPASSQHTFTINPTPANANVVINGVSTNSVTVDNDTPIYWSVDASGYNKQTGTSIPISSNVTKNVTLDNDTTNDYLTFTIISGGNIYWYANQPGREKTIEYSLNNGAWTSITSSNVTADVPTIAVVAGDVLRFRGDNAAYSIDNNFGSIFNKTSGTTATFDVSGNIMSLVNSTNFSGLTSVSNYAFPGLFSGCNVRHAKNLKLPATTLGLYCYNSLFLYCSNLISCPVLPASTLKSSCYRAMFMGCQNLEDVPELPATTLASYCYNRMFYNCAKITVAPKLPATTLSQCDSCYREMYYGCQNLQVASDLPALHMGTSNPYKASSCYSEMYYGCVSLEKSGIISANVQNYQTCYQMFYGCTNLKEVTCYSLYNDTSVFSDWLSGVAATGTFIKNPNMTSWTTGTSGIPTGWTVVDQPYIQFNAQSGVTVFVNGRSISNNRYIGTPGETVSYTAESSISGQRETGTATVPLNAGEVTYVTININDNPPED